MIVRIDSREDVRLLKKAKKIFPDYILEALPIGDLIIEDDKRQVIFERKSIVDLINSIRSGHLNKQLLQMEQFQYPYLIVVGTFADLRFIPGIHFSIETQLGTLASILVRYKTKIVFVSNNIQYLNLAFAIFNKTEDGKILGLQDTELMREKITVEDTKLRLFASIPGINIEIGKRLKEKFDLRIIPKIETNLSLEKELENIKGLGEKKIKIILEIFK